MDQEESVDCNRFWPLLHVMNNLLVPIRYDANITNISKHILSRLLHEPFPTAVRFLVHKKMQGAKVNFLHSSQR